MAPSSEREPADLALVVVDADGVMPEIGKTRARPIRARHTSDLALAYETIEAAKARRSRHLAQLETVIERVECAPETLQYAQGFVRMHGIHPVKRTDGSTSLSFAVWITV